MSYQRAIEKFNDIYKKSDIENILGRWSRNSGDLNVYVHSPFCAGICKFCNHKGLQFSHEKDSALYDKYYTSYLPESVKPFLPLLQEKTVGNFFFGGGTPSLMRTETMESVFGLFPGIKEVKSKTFEIHPGVWQREQLDVLAKHAFNCCIIGIQSFDKGVLERQDRPHVTFEKVQELMQCIRNRGMYVAADLIYRMDDQKCDEIFRRDLDLINRLEPDVISLQPNYELITESEDVDRFLELISGSEIPKAYYGEWGKNSKPAVDMKNPMKCFRYIRNGVSTEIYKKEIFPFIDTLDEAEKNPYCSRYASSVIGFGSYRNCEKNTFSTIRNNESITEYIEINNGWKPEYFITYEYGSSDYFRNAVEELELLNDIGAPPAGMKIILQQTTTTIEEDTIYRRSYPKVDLSVEWDYMRPAIREYAEKLQLMFPHWNWHSNK